MTPPSAPPPTRSPEEGPPRGGGRRPRSRKGEGGRLRDDILDAAEALLLETGDMSSLSMRAIAAAVGVTPPSIYIHFADRNEMIFAVCDRKWRQLEEQLDRAAAGADDPLERVVRRGRAYLQFGLDHPEHYRVLLMSREGEVPDRYADEAVLTQRLAFDPLVADLREAMAAGQIVETDPFEVCLVLFGAVHGLTSLLLTKTNFDWPPVDQLYRRMVQTAIDGLRPRIAPAPSTGQ